MFGCTIFFGFLAVVMFGVKSSQDMRAKLQNGCVDDSWCVF